VTNSGTRSSIGFGIGVGGDLGIGAGDDLGIGAGDDLDVDAGDGFGAAVAGTAGTT
jgi:hypothetical protein